MADGVKVGTGYIQVMPEMKDFTSSLKSQVSGSMDSEGSSAGSKFSNGFKKGLSIAATAAAAATTAVTAFAGASVNVGKEFDASMSQVAATMGTTTDQISDLRDFAMEMGRTTAFSATEASEALNYMALAGYDANTSMEMLPTVLDLAAAGNIALASASDMVTDAQSALGLSLDETSELVDKMAKASSKSNTSVAQLGDAILKIGGTANIMSGGTTELATALGLLADNGIKGAEGGTHLRNILLSLAAPTDTAATALNSLGVEAVDSEGNLRPLEDVMLDLNDALADYGDADKAAIISSIFNKTDIAAVNALLGTSKDRWEELSDAIDDSTGAAKAMAETQLDNLAGDITLFKSALEGAQITLSDVLTPSLREFVQFGTDAVSGLTAAFQEGGLSGAMSALGDYISQGADMLMDALPSILEAGMALLDSLLDGLVDNTPKIVETAVTLITSFIEHISTMLPELISAFLEITTQVFEAIIANLPQILSSLWTALTGSLEALGSNLEGTGIILGAMLVKGISSKGLSGIQDMIGKIGSMFTEGFSAGGIVGVAIAGIAGVAAATKLVTDSWKDAYAESSPFTEALLNVSAVNDTLAASIQNTKDKYDASVTGSEANAAAAEALYGKLQDLITAYDGTAGQQELIVGLVDELNELVPGLGLAWDEVTNSLNLTNEEILNNIELMRVQAQVAALQEMYIQSLKDQYTAQKNYELALSSTHAAMEEYGITQQELNAALEDGILGYDEWLQMTGQSIFDIYNAYTSLDQFTNQIIETGESYHNLTDVTENVNWAEEKLIEATADLAEQTQTTKDSMVEAANEINEEVNFDPAVESAATAGEEIPAEFASSIESGQPQVETAASEMADAVVNEVSDVPSEMYDTGSDAGSEMDSGVTSQLDSVKNTVQTMASYFGTETAQIGMGLYNLATTAVTGFATAIATTASEQVVPAINAMVTGISASLSTLPNSMYSVGDMAGSGLYNGLSAWSGALSSLAWSIANSINAAARAALQIHSPSKVMQEVGLYTAEGLSIGLEDGTQEVMDSTDNMILGVIGASDYRYEMENDTQDGDGEDIGSYLSQIMVLLDKISKMQMVTDTGALVGEMAEAMNERFEAIRLREGRG